MSGRYAFNKGLREIRFHLCQQCESSAATRYDFHESPAVSKLKSHPRAFLTRAYPTMKRNNPSTPILIREALGVEPKIWARYGLSTPPRRDPTRIEAHMLYRIRKRKNATFNW